nr:MULTISPECIES: hypothetical protein [unclassified Paraglaciecola]|tara:strand:+ start:4244 stop:4576 length:333 start_codon:yes stop_codon:yes gene_type:complete
MSEKITRMTKMGDWVFEVKMVRALKVAKHGDPYSAVAMLTANGEQMYIDTQLTKDNEELSKSDFLTIYKFCESLDMKYVCYDRMKNGVRSSKVLAIEPTKVQRPAIRLVK